MRGEGGGGEGGRRVEGRSKRRRGSRERGGEGEGQLQFKIHQCSHPPTFSLWSFLFTIRAVICWSMNRRMVARIAKGTAITGAQEGSPLPAQAIYTPRSEHIVAL